MSGNPTGSNVVPMPHAQAPATNPAQSPMPFPMWGGGGSLPWGPGCCPPGGMDALMKCYCDVQAATAFICSVMVQCIQTNPAVTAAIIAAIEASGSSLPLIGVTNGSLAQPGQVGEFISMPFTMNFNNGATTGTVSAGILQPGDWDMWVVSSPTALLSNFSFGLSPTPAGQGAPVGNFYVLSGSESEAFVLMSTLGQGSYSVPTLMAFGFQTVATGAGAVDCTFYARRMR